MSLKTYPFIICLWLSHIGFSQIAIKDYETQYPVSYATIAFGNGHGVFADDEGVFIFNKKLYPDVDTLSISALGYKDLKIASHNLTKTLYLETQIDELDEVLVNVKANRKFKEETLKPYLDDDYYKCWLPTIESEIAVFFPNTTEEDKKITQVHFPIALESKDWKKRKRSNADKQKFSTLFKVKFYKNDNGYPGKSLTKDIIVFRATEKDGDAHNLEVSRYNIMFPENGFFVSLQVLGYTDHNGKLLPNKKYKEIKSRDGIVRIPTNFRPLLPFTNEIEPHHTFIKRVFLHDNNWIRFEQGSGIDSSLLKTGLYNYGIGITYNLYKNE